MIYDNVYSPENTGSDKTETDIYTEDKKHDDTMHDHSLSIMNIHGARRAGRRRRKVCMGWSCMGCNNVQAGAHCAASRTACLYYIGIVNLTK